MENLSFSKVFRYVKKFVAMAFLCSFMSFGIYHSVAAVADITSAGSSEISTNYMDINGGAYSGTVSSYSLDNVVYVFDNSDPNSRKVYAVALKDPTASTTVLRGKVNVGSIEYNVKVYNNILAGVNNNSEITVLDADSISVEQVNVVEGGTTVVADTPNVTVTFNCVGGAAANGTAELKKLVKTAGNATVNSVPAVTNSGGIYIDGTNRVSYKRESSKTKVTYSGNSIPVIYHTVYDSDTGEKVEFDNPLDLSSFDEGTELELVGFGNLSAATLGEGLELGGAETAATYGGTMKKIQKIKNSAVKSELKCSVTDVAYAMDNSENALAIASNISAEGGKLFKKVTDKNGNVVEGTWSWVTTPSSFAEGTTTTGKLKFTPSNTDLYSGNPEVNVKVFNTGTKTTFAEDAAGQKFNQYVTKDGVTYVRLGSKENTPYTWLKETIGKSGNDQRYFAFANGQALPEGTIVSIEWLSDTENAEEFNRLASVLSNTGVYFEGNRKYLFKIHAYNPDTFEPIKDFGGKTQDIFIQRDPSWDENDIGAYYVSKDGNTEWKSKSVSLVAPWNSQTIDGELITMTHFSDNVVGDKVDVGQKLGNVLIENWDKFSEKVQALGGESKWTVDNFRKIMKDIVNASSLSQNDKDAINKWLDSSGGTSFINELIKANKSTAAEGAKKASSSSSSGTSSGTSAKTSSGTTSGTTTTTSGTTTKSASTKTGDASSILPYLLTLLSGSTGAIISLKKKKRL